MVGRRDQLHDVGAPGLGDQVLVVDGAFHQADIEVLGDHLLGDVAGVGADQLQLDARIGPMKRAEISRDHVGRDRRRGADPQRAVVKPAQRGQLFLGRALDREQRLGAPRQREPLRRRHDALGGTVEQPAADLKLEVPHALGDRGLADIEDLGGLRKAAAANHGREHAQQMEVEGHNLFLSGYTETIFSISR